MTLLGSTARYGLLALAMGACDEASEQADAAPGAPDASQVDPSRGDVTRPDAALPGEAAAPALDARVDVAREHDARTPGTEDARVEDARLGDADVEDARVHEPRVDASAPACSGADVIWLLDSSGSLLFAQPASQRNFAELMRRAPAADLNVILVTSTAPSTPDAGAPGFHHVQTDVDSKALFSTLLTQYPKLAPYLRAGAATHVVGITDDQDLLPAPQFERELEALLGHGFTFHAVASPSLNGMTCVGEDQQWNPQCVTPIPAICGAAAVGTAYYEAATLTGGEQVSICKHDWSAVLDRLTCP